MMSYDNFVKNVIDLLDNGMTVNDIFNMLVDAAVEEMIDESDIIECANWLGLYINEHELSKQIDYKRDSSNKKLKHDEYVANKRNVVKIENRYKRNSENNSQLPGPFDDMCDWYDDF